MNIFILHGSPVLSAQLQCNKHVVKMILETAQLLSTAHRMLDGQLFIDSSSGRKAKRWRLADEQLDAVLYKATHANHPSAVWARESAQNYMWLYEHFKALSDEYEFRYGKVHATWQKLGGLLSTTPKSIPDVGLTPFKLAMPEQFKSSDPVQSYRDYYISKQVNFKMLWQPRDVPDWFKKVA